jgi:uncharacterized membrane protein YgdD (TMEM256/DUF423 family)
VQARVFAAGAVAAGTGVALGAFAAHALRGRLAPESLAAFETGVRYQLVHALALVATALASDALPERWLRRAAWAFGIGIVAFSGSLYALALTGQRALGMVTPVGGLAFLAGWTALVFASARRRDHR